MVPGLVQELEFGMNWSGHSRFVGDVLGAALAMEGLAAFCLESTFAIAVMPPVSIRASSSRGARCAHARQ